MRFLQALLLLYTLQTEARSTFVHDSLFELYQSYPEDTSKCSLLYNKGWELRTKDPLLSYQYAEYCLKAAERLKSDVHIAKANNLLGVLYYRNGRLNEAMHYHQKARSIWTKLNNKSWLAYNDINVANVLLDQEKWEEAKALLLHAIQLFEITKNSKQQANALINLSIAYYGKKQFNNAIKCLDQAFVIAEHLNDYELKAMCSNNMGQMAEESGNLVLAKAYYEESLKIKNLIDNESELADTYINLARVASCEGDEKAAKDYFEMAKGIVYKYDYKEAELELTKELSAHFEKAKLFDSALFYTKKYYTLKSTFKTDDSEFTDLPVLSSDEPYLKTKEESASMKWLLIGSLLCVLVLIMIVIKKSSHGKKG